MVVEAVFQGLTPLAIDCRRFAADATMRTIRAADRPTVPAGHENPASPGTWKRVLCQRDELQPGSVQMVNWATMPVGRQFAAHYHEDMQEVFIILQGEAELTAGGQTVVLRRGDTVIIDARETRS